PAHDDSSPSLSINEGDSGKVLFRCFAGCSQDAVISALRSKGLSHANGFDHSASPARHPELGPPDIRYEYTDRDDVTLGWIYRWNARPGRKKQIRPMWFLDGRWKWEHAPSPRPLYGLAELAAFPDRAVLLVEGEKAAAGARDLIDSHVVMTWPGGTGAVAHIDLTPLKGRTIVLWPDNDEPGRKAMRAIADRLTDARTVKGVKLPDDLPDGWDLGDAVPADLDPIALIGRAIDV